ncbi:MAG: hypothetical protein K5853_05825 [Lachnospiraceae bacterium]|nr:hypothetical protein [Lachnospiraceae bacterium]
MFRDEKITEEIPKELLGRIPKNYRAAIDGGQMSAYAVYDDVGGKSDLFGIYVTTIHDGWLELVWESIEDPAVTTTEKALFFSHIVKTDKKRRQENLKGAFVELHEDEAWPDAVEALRLSGMEARFGDGNVFEFALSQVKGAEALKKAADRVGCVSLLEADEKCRRSLLNLLQLDERPVPFPEEVDWSMYVPEISFISKKSDVPSGVILFSEQDDYIVAELGFSVDAVALPALLWNALHGAMEKYGPSQKVLVPVVVNKTGLLVKKLVPDAQRTRIINGLVRF